MDAPECPGFRRLEGEVRQLREEVLRLRALLGKNSSNSSTPPSSNPLGAPKPVVMKKSRRQPGGQPGHPPHLKELLPPDLSYFSGCHGVSKRGVEEIAAAVFDAPIALGTVANLEQEVSAALAAPHQEAVAVVRVAEVKHADETSWKLAGSLCCLWGAASRAWSATIPPWRRSATTCWRWSLRCGRS